MRERKVEREREIEGEREKRERDAIDKCCYGLYDIYITILRWYFEVHEKNLYMCLLRLFKCVPL